MGGSILVVDDDETVVRAVVRELRVYRPCLAAFSATEALATIRTNSSLCGLVVDIRLETARSGTEVLAAFRSQHRAEPALVLTGALEPTVVADSDLFQARLVLKGDERHAIRSFGVACFSADLAIGDDLYVRSALVSYARRYGLSAGEMEVLSAAVHGVRAEEFSTANAISVAGYKWRVRTMLDKIGGDSLSEVVRELLICAVRSAGAPETMG